MGECYQMVLTLENFCRLFFAKCLFVFSAYAYKLLIDILLHSCYNITMIDKCKKCLKPITAFDTFPQNLCVDCYEKIMNKIPLDKLEKPDFIKALNLK